MKKIILLLVFAYNFNGYSQVIKDSVLYKKQNLFRELSISLPPSYNKETKKTYPLLFLLDGDYLFDPFHGALCYGYYWDTLPEVIIVGLKQSGKRSADCAIDAASGLPDEAGDEFYNFISNDLLNYVQNKYRISPFKIIAGHDITAGFENFYLYQENSKFNAFISLSPELSLDMVTEIPEGLTTFKGNVFYYLSSSDGDVKKLKEKISALDTNIKAVANPNLNYKYDDFINASHYSLVLYSIPSALNQIFASYLPITSSEFDEKIMKLDSGYVAYLTNKYDNLENALKIKMNIRVNDLGWIEAAIMKNKAYAELEQLAQLSRKMYPKAMLGDYQMALYYEATGDIKNAAKYYLSAFQLQEISGLTKDMMLEKATELKAQIKK